VIAPVTLYLFMIGGLLSLGWCIIVMILSMAGSPPKTSMFPEVDFASKVTGQHADTDSLAAEPLINELARLSNATSREIRTGLARNKFYIRAAEVEVEPQEGLRPVTLVSDNGGSRLSHRDIEDISGARQEALYRYSRTSYHE